MHKFAYISLLYSVTGLLSAASLSHEDAYRRIAGELAKQSPMFGEIGPIPSLEIDEAALFGPAAWLRGKAYIKLDKDALTIKSVLNKPLKEKLEEFRNQHLAPRYSFEEAVTRARDYFAAFGIKLPKDIRIRTVAFNQAYPGLWEVRWEWCWNGYPLDDSHGLPETAVAIFHEEDGLYLLGMDLHSPAPTSLTTRYSRDDAITKAEKLTDDVMRTSFYQSMRLPGFKATSLVSCELKAVKPNWLLDPERAIWISNKAPEETRLAWIVKFSTIDTKGPERPKNDKGVPMQFMKPEIILYIDANTGECIGATFS